MRQMMQPRQRRRIRGTRIFAARRADPPFRASEGKSHSRRSQHFGPKRIDNLDVGKLQKVRVRGVDFPEPVEADFATAVQRLA